MVKDIYEFKYFTINFLFLQPSGDQGSGSQESIFEFESEDLQLLPLRDIAVFGNHEVTQDFGFTVGPVCFS